jgi:hypothetical protein
MWGKFLFSAAAGMFTNPRRVGEVQQDLVSPKIQNQAMFHAA